MEDPDLDWWDESFTEQDKRFLKARAWWMRAFGCDCDPLSLTQIHPVDPECSLYPRRHMEWIHLLDCGYRARLRVAAFN
jgi:hypothetical protein